MKILNKEEIFKLEVIHQFNNPIMIKAFSAKPIEELIVDNGIELRLPQHKTSIHNNYHISYFNLNQNYKAQLQEQLKEHALLNFNFKPSYIIDADAVHLVPNDAGAEYELSDCNVINVQYSPSFYNQCSISFEASWVFKKHKSSLTRAEISVYDFQKLCKRIPVAGDHNKLRILSSQVKQKNVRWFRDEDDSTSFYSLTDCEFEMIYSYHHNVARVETLSFEVCVKDQATQAKQKKVEYKLKLPHRPTLENWKSGQIYIEGDCVFFENNAYKAKLEHSDVKFDVAKWEKVKKEKYLSFNNVSSFFENDAALNTLTKIRNALPLIVEENIGSAVMVELHIQNSALPSLNDWFMHANKKFRIVKIVESYGEKNIVKLYGQELMQDISITQLDNDYCEGYVDDYFAELPWLHDENDETAMIKIYNADEHAKHGLEGIAIMVPEDTESRSVAKVSGTC